jgi:excisionase family DNA binding protein
MDRTLLRMGEGELPDLGWHGTPAACRYLGVNPRTLYGLVHRGELAGYQIARVYRFQRADLDAFLERSRIPPGTLGHLIGGGALKDEEVLE